MLKTIQGTFKSGGVELSEPAANLDGCGWRGKKYSLAEPSAVHAGGMSYFISFSAMNFSSLTASAANSRIPSASFSVAI